MDIPKLGGIGLTSSQRRTTQTLSKTNRALSKILERLATAKRINRASDDAAGLAVAEQLTTQMRGFKIAEQNVADAMSALNIADGASTEIENMLQRQRELAIQARNGTLTDDQRQMLDVEYQNLTEEIGRIAESTQFNTQNVSNNQGLATGSAEIQVGPNAGQTITLPAVDMTAAGLGIGGTSIATAAGAAGAMNVLDTAIESMGSQRAALGSMVNRLESTQNNLMVAEVNTTAAESILRDEDMAIGIAELTKNRLLMETGTRAFSRFNEISANHILGLLQQ
jgi:flagellin